MNISSKKSISNEQNKSKGMVAKHREKKYNENEVILVI